MRLLFLPRVAPPPGRREEAWVWRAAASNNSGDWTIAARFCDEETAARVAERLRELARAHEAFLASPEGQHWIEERDCDGSHPPPPLVRFGEAHGFDWSRQFAGALALHGWLTAAWCHEPSEANCARSGFRASLFCATRACWF